MLFLFVILGAAIVAVLVWRTLGAEQAAPDRPDRPAEPAGRPSPPRVGGPDDDPEFLRSLDERVRRRDDDPPAGQ